MIKGGPTAGTAYPGDFRLADKLPLPPDDTGYGMVGMLPYAAYQEPGPIRSQYNDYNDGAVLGNGKDMLAQPPPPLSMPPPPPPSIDANAQPLPVTGPNRISRPPEVGLNVDTGNRPRAKSIVRNWIYSEPTTSISMIGGGGFNAATVDRIRRMQPAARRSLFPANYSQFLDQAMVGNDYYRHEFRLRNDGDDANDPDANRPEVPRYSNSRPTSVQPPQYNRSNDLFDRRLPLPNGHNVPYNVSQFGPENQLFHRKR